jgi:hypothetical protein
MENFHIRALKNEKLQPSFRKVIKSTADSGVLFF